MKFPVHNPTDSPMYVAGKMIPGGETAHFDLHELPPEMRPAAEPTAPAEQTNPLEDVLKAPVKAVLAEVDALTVDEINALIELEQAAGKPRSTLVEALSAEVLKRQAAALDAAAGGQGAGDQGAGDEGTGDQGAGDNTAGEQGA